MPTTKKRLNITLNDELAEFIKLISERDNVPQATKAAELLKKAMEEEEDEIWGMIAEERVKEQKREKLDLIPADEFWSNV